MKKIILASASPRRRDLLDQIGLEFEIKPSDVDESIPENDPIKLVKKLALLKARDIAQNVEGIVIGADTIVVDDQTILGKPETREDAFEMLKGLSGKQHQVITGVAVIDTESDREWVDLGITQVFFRSLSDAEINDYIDSGEPMGKAGSYAIQEKGALFVEKIEGDFFNVVGLPLVKMAELLKEIDANILAPVK